MFQLVIYKYSLYKGFKTGFCEGTAGGLLVDEMLSIN